MNQLHQIDCLKSSVIDLNNGYHHSHQQHQSSTQTTTDTTTAKTAATTAKQLQLLDLTARHELRGAETNLANFSNSEPHLCAHFQHDINCAKNQSYINDRHSIKGLPNT